MNNKIASMLSGMAWFFNQKSTYLPKKKITTPLPNGAMEPREPGDPADGSETEKSLAALFFLLCPGEMV